MRKDLQTFIVVILAQLSIGCCGFSGIRYSKPTLEGDAGIPVKSEKYVGDMFVTPDVAFHVYPLNGKDSGLAICPIPFPYGESKTESTRFLIGVSLKPTKPGMSFIPQDVLFWRVAADPHRPISVIGPFECASSEPRPLQRSLPVEPILLKENTATCFWLDVSVTPPDPAEIFFIQIKGLSLDGRQYSLPIIRFQEDKRRSTFALP
jgi:hypothetical protein